MTYVEVVGILPPIGSTSLTLDASGNKIGEMKYYPYGETRPGYPIGSVPTDRRFTGQRQDSYINLYEMGARWYDPALGRWLSADTVVPDGKNPQTWNHYSYVFNNPIRLIDPSGHKPICDDKDPCITPISWDKYALENTTLEDRRKAEEAYYDFLADPAKYLGYLTDPATLAEHEDYNSLSIFAEGVEHTPVDEFILSNFPGLAPETIYASQLEKWPTYETGQPLAVGAALPIGGVYVLRNSDEIVRYVGRTNNLARRALEHGRLHPGLKFDPVAETDSYEVQRGLEQILYDKYQPPLNRIRPISLRNLKIEGYLRAAKSFLLGEGPRERE